MSRSVKDRVRPTQKRLRELFYYVAETGYLQRHKPRTNKVAFGCCSLATPGHYQVWVDGALYPAHVIIWVLVTGEWPDRDIDHANGVKTDNRWSNLRKASRSQNSANRKIHCNNVLGFKGVSPKGSRFLAIVVKDYKVVYRGTFLTPERAHAAYIKAAKKWFGDFANDGAI